MIRYRFYVGTRDGQDASKPACHDEAHGYLVREFGGYTAVNAQGAWADGGKVYTEPSVVYEVLAEEQPGHSITTGDSHAQLIRALARQQCVLWTCERVYGGFANA